MTKTETKYLTVAQVAGHLKMTTDGVYKLIQRGKLDAERVSERKTQVSEASLSAYQERQRNAVAAFRNRSPQPDDTQELVHKFEAAFKVSPNQFLSDWKAGHIEDTPENMRALARAAGIAAMQPAAVAA